MATKRASRKVQGRNQHVFVAKAINYSTDATLELFLAAANTLGEFGVYDGSNARHTDLITSTEEFFFALRTTQGIKRTPLYKLAEVTSKKKAYVAAVKQLSGIGWYRTGGSLNLGTIAAGKVYGLKVIETTEGNDPFPTWNYDYVAKANDDQMIIMQALAKKVNDDNGVEHKQNQRLVVAKVVADATYGAYAVGAGGTLTVTNGSDVITTAVGTINAALNDLIAFDAAAAASDTVGDIYKIIRVIDANNYQLNRVYTGATQVFTEAEAEGTRINKVTAVVTAGLEFTTIDADVVFKLAVYDELVNADISYTTAYTRSNGTYDQVRLLEKEGDTFNGETTQNVAFSDKYGEQDQFSVAAETYDFYHFDVVKSEKGIGLEVEHKERQGVTIAVAKSAGNVAATLNTLFAL